MEACFSFPLKGFGTKKSLLRISNTETPEFNSLIPSLQELLVINRISSQTTDLFFADSSLPLLLVTLKYYHPQNPVSNL